MTVTHWLSYDCFSLAGVLPGEEAAFLPWDRKVVFQCEVQGRSLPVGSLLENKW